MPIQGNNKRRPLNKNEQCHCLTTKHAAIQAQFWSGARPNANRPVFRTQWAPLPPSPAKRERYRAWRVGHCMRWAERREDEQWDDKIENMLGLHEMNRLALICFDRCDSEQCGRITQIYLSLGREIFFHSYKVIRAKFKINIYRGPEYNSKFNVIKMLMILPFSCHAQIKIIESPLPSIGSITASIISDKQANAKICVGAHGFIQT